MDEVALSNSFYKSQRAIDHALSRTRAVRERYIEHHRRHFRYTFAQAVGFLLIYAVASSTLLGLGGWLVIRGELTIGQLVAAELILAAIFYNLTRGIYYLELYYDLYAAMTKLLQLVGVEPENINAGSNIPSWSPLLNFSNVHYKHDRGELIFDFKLPANSKTLMVVRSSVQEYAISDLLQGFTRENSGQVLIDGHDVGDFNAHELRDEIVVVDATPLPVCSISDYLHIADPRMSRAEMRGLLDAVGLNSDLPSISRAIDETLMPGGYPLSPVGLLKLKIAYALATKPKFLILTTQFDTLSMEARLTIMSRLDSMSEMTVLCFTHRQDLDNFDQFIFCDFEKQTGFDSLDDAFNAYKVSVADSLAVVEGSRTP